MIGKRAIAWLPIKAEEDNLKLKKGDLQPLEIHSPQQKGEYFYFFLILGLYSYMYIHMSLQWEWGEPKVAKLT